MKEASLVVKPRGWLFGVLAVTILVVFLGIIVWLLQHVEAVELARFDWTAAEAVATVLGAGMAAAAGLAAVFAARVALSVDTRVAERIREREHRDALPLAIAIQYELLSTFGDAEGFIKFARENPGTASLKNLRELQERLATPTLERHFSGLGCFDEDVGGVLARAMTASSSMRQLLNPKYFPSIEEDIQKLEKEVIEDLEMFLPFWQSAVFVLKRITGINMDDQLT